MPLYTYQCKDCGVRFERRQGFDDAPITVCPECEGIVHRLIQPAGVIFKGSGFYINDHKTSSPTGSPAKGDKSSTDTAKPAAKTKTVPSTPSAKSDN